MLERLKKLDVAIILFIITGLGYSTAYIYELGYKYRYSLPSSLIDLSLTNVTRSILIVSLFFGLSFLLNFYNDSTKENSSKDESKIKLNIVTIFFLLSLMAFSLIMNNKFDIVAAAIISMACLIFITFILRTNKLLQYLLLLAYAIILIFKLGFNLADQSDYLVIKDKDLVVVDYYQDKAIVAKADFEKNIIYPEYQFIKLESTEIDKVKFELVHTGKMKIKKAEKN